MISTPLERGGGKIMYDEMKALALALGGVCVGQGHCERVCVL